MEVYSCFVSIFQFKKCKRKLYGFRNAISIEQKNGGCQPIHWIVLTNSGLVALVTFLRPHSLDSGSRRIERHLINVNEVTIR